jgi:hypothetical protein
VICANKVAGMSRTELERAYVALFATAHVASREYLHRRGTCLPMSLDLDNQMKALRTNTCA